MHHPFFQRKRENADLVIKTGERIVRVIPLDELLPEKIALHPERHRFPEEPRGGGERYADDERIEPDGNVGPRKFAEGFQKIRDVLQSRRPARRDREEKKILRARSPRRLVGKNRNRMTGCREFRRETPDIGCGPPHRWRNERRCDEDADAARLRSKVPEDTPELLGDPLPPVARRGLPSRGGNAFAERFVIEEKLDRFGNVFGRIRPRCKAILAVAEEIRYPADGGCNHRQPRGHCLEEHVAKTLRARRPAEYVGASEVARNLAKRYCPCETNGAPLPEIANQRLELAAERPLADDEQLHGMRDASGVEVMDSSDERINAIFYHKARRGDDDPIIGGKPEFAAERYPRVPRKLCPECGRIHPVRNNDRLPAPAVGTRETPKICTDDVQNIAPRQREAPRTRNHAAPLTLDMLLRISFLERQEHRHAFPKPNDVHEIRNDACVRHHHAPKTHRLHAPHEAERFERPENRQQHFVARESEPDADHGSLRPRGNSRKIAAEPRGDDEETVLVREPSCRLLDCQLRTANKGEIGRGECENGGPCFLCHTDNIA